MEPNVELARDAGLEVRSGIVVNERFETSKPGVYAIGDVAEFFDPVFGRHRRIEHWSNAAYHGTTLGRILAGEDARYDAVSSFFSEQFGRSFKSFGDPLGHDTTALEGDFREDRAVLRFLREGKAVGAVTTGLDEDAENELKDEIRAGAATTFSRYARREATARRIVAQLGDRTALHRHHPDAVDGRRPEGERGPSRHRDGARPDRVPALHRR